MKATFEFDESDENFDRCDLECVANLPKIRCALYDLSDLLSIIVNRKFYDDTTYLTQNDKEYVNIDYVENKLRDIIDKVDHLIDY